MSEDEKHLQNVAKRMAVEMQAASSDSERLEVLKQHLEDDTLIGEDQKDKIIDDFVQEVEIGGGWLHRDTLIDALRDEVMEEVEDTLPNWVPIAQEAARSHANQTILALNSLVELMEKSNSLAVEQDILNPLQKAQLIAVLQSAIEELKGPVVDRGRMGQISSWFVKILLKQRDKATSDVLGEGVSYAKNSLKDLLDILPKNGPPSF